MLQSITSILLTAGAAFMVVPRERRWLWASIGVAVWFVGTILAIASSDPGFAAGFIQGSTGSWKNYDYVGSP